MANFRYDPLEDTRDYDAEARELIKDLSDGKKYALYEIVIEKQKRANNPVRDKELNAVKRAIESDRWLDKDRLARIFRGYRSSMAANARPEDGFTKPAKKKV
jgi:hypothetical protein